MDHFVALAELHLLRGRPAELRLQLRGTQIERSAHVIFTLLLLFRLILPLLLHFFCLVFAFFLSFFGLDIFAFEIGLFGFGRHGLRLAEVATVPRGFAESRVLHYLLVQVGNQGDLVRQVVVAANLAFC